MPVAKKSREKIPAKSKAGARGRSTAPEQVANSSPLAENQAKGVLEIPVEEYQSHAKKVVSENFAHIVQTMAEKSAKGSLSHTKYLFEIGGVKEEIQRQGQGEDEPSLADLLLAEIRKRQTAEETAAEDADKASAESGAADTEERGKDCGAKAQ
jgi:hypothetical protein